ncbi:AzlD domain-containing protein [Undibacterium griseum]|uniref:AzlD domain-containing protein n=1 Tax=Undibacterium griseum TaxID=2762295 RepID=A0ABR6YKL4_9BURK|nr:AzlD domain-containing protein [Undibacterium griseum]MBC3884353.1 AzlD domain-containing protein [Undibacterium griseum]
MSDLEIWGVILLLTLATMIARSGFWLAGNRINLPKRVQEALRYAPACALAAIIVPDLLFYQSQMNFTINNPRLVAGVMATIYFLLRRNMLQTIFFGMAVFTVVRLAA